jgi:hypothetical protein
MMTLRGKVKRFDVGLQLSEQPVETVFGLISQLRLLRQNASRCPQIVLMGRAFQNEVEAVK